MKMRFILMGFSCIFFVSGCSTRIAALNMVSTKNVSLKKINLERLHGKKVVGVSSKPIFIIIPLGLPTLQEAVDDALEKGRGDLMLDAVVYDRSYWFILGVSKIVVKGTVVNTKEYRDAKDK